MSPLRNRPRSPSSQGEARPFAGMRQVTRHAAGVDIGAQEIMACVPDGDNQQLVRAFGTSTADLDAVADWCVDRGLPTAAMASTGVDWLPLCEPLAARGIQCCLLSAPALTHVPGRKSEVLDCQWMQPVHSDGV
jgi:transposase